MSTSDFQQISRSQAAAMDLKATMKFQDKFRRILRMRQWKKSGAMLSEEGDILEAANIVSVSSKKQVIGGFDIRRW